MALHESSVVIDLQDNREGKLFLRIRLSNYKDLEERWDPERVENVDDDCIPHWAVAEVVDYKGNFVDYLGMVCPEDLAAASMSIRAASNARRCCW